MYYSLSADRSVKYRLDRARKKRMFLNFPMMQSVNSFHGLSLFFSMFLPPLCMSFLHLFPVF